VGSIEVGKDADIAIFDHHPLSVYAVAQKTLVDGEVYFERDVFLRALQVLDFDEGLIQRYSYEVYRGEEKLYWYDSWPHPHVPELASTDPHHKHIPPDIKHNRVPAPELSFERPKLPFIIQEIVDNLLK
jgi:hypothetical protein